MLLHTRTLFIHKLISKKRLARIEFQSYLMFKSDTLLDCGFGQLIKKTPVRQRLDNLNRKPRLE